VPFLGKRDRATERFDFLRPPLHPHNWRSRMGLTSFVKTSALAMTATAALVMGWAAGAQTAPNRSPAAVETDAVMPLYAEDGVFMAPYSPSSVGTTAVRKAYESTFKVIKLTVKFDVVEVVQIGSEWVFARTNSAGTVTVHATGAKSAEANQELFVFKKRADGMWRIARYSFSPTNPPSRP
jgi:uncharacterized protein (TIGR02246 family)